jgi:hypothetical protein
MAPRALYLLKLARDEDRAAILEPSYFAEARRIRAEDEKPFVLVEPRKSADLYVSIQPFFGARMITTRHLVVSKMNFDLKPPEAVRVDGSLLVTDADLPHLWTLTAHRTGKDGEGPPYAWRAQRLITRRNPGVYLFADNYEQDRARHSRGRDGGDWGTFSYVRNGSAMVFVPSGAAALIEVKLTPTDQAQFQRTVDEIAKRIADGELGGLRMTQDGSLVTLKEELPESSAPRLVAVSRLSGEYWLNVRVNGKDVTSDNNPAGRTERVSGVLVRSADGSARITASWSGIASPHKDDWIGVFPVAGQDPSRIAFKFLGGQAQGTIVLDVPPGSAGKQYELRLFDKGSWNTLAVSAPVPLQAP